ncbi:TPA: tail fiber domain-containing protein [Klebsiella pneumoniae]|nr:tail fiber domain-containing protein [Klebsiella pneumoniae]
MANEIKFIRFKRTETAGRVPTAAQIEIGSVALNMADKAIFSKNSAGQVVQFTGAGADMPAKTVTATGTIKSNTGVQAGNAKLGTDGNITGGSKFGGNLDNYLNSIKGEISSTDKAVVKKAGDVMTGPLVINTSGNSDPAVNGLSVSGSQHTPIMLTRNTDKNLNIGFKLTGGSTVINRKLGIDSDGTLHWGPNDNQAANGRVVTQDYIDDHITELKGGYRGSEVGVDLGGWNGSVNDLFIGNNEDIGTVRTWFCASTAGGNNITDVPAGKGNFVLRVESLRSANGVDYKNKQTFISGDASKTYVRYGTGTGTTTAPEMNWDPWLVSQEFSNGVTPISNGGTGATNVGDARNNLGLRTAAIRDVGESNGNVMEVGAFGVGGVGKSIVDITSDVDLMTRLKAIGGTTFRANVKTVNGKAEYTGSPYYSHGAGFFSRTGDTMSALNIDYATGNVRVFAANDSGLASGKVNSNLLYGTANKPSKADVGLGNLTNDTQVKKAGDTMTGDLTVPNLHASGTGTASVYVNAGTGNAHVWFRTNGNERGVIWANPNTADLGQINIRAKTTGNTSAGDFSFRSDGRLDVPVAVKVGGAAMLTKDGNITSGSMFGGNLNNYLNSIKNDITAGNNKQVSKTGDTMTGNLTINANLKVENPNGTMVDLGSENSDKYSRLTLARKVGSGAAVAMLKVTPEGHVQFGYQDAVATPAPTKYILVKSNGLEVEGDLVFNQTYRGTEEAVDITDKTNDLNNMVIKGSDLGTRLLYKCTSTGGASNILNRPTSDGNFVLEVLSLRKISDTDWTCKQTFTTKNGNVEGTYVRYCQNGTWSAWKEVVAGVQPINLGGTGATSVAAARNNLGVGEGQSVKFGGLVVGGNTTLNADLIVKGNSRFTGVINADGNINVASGKFVIAGQAPTDNSHLTNKKYVDDRVASAISSAASTYLPLTGGTVTGNLDVTGTRLKTWQLEVDSKSTLRGGLDVSNSLKVSSGNLVAADTTNAGGLFAKNGNVYCDAGSPGTNSNYWFRDSAGNTRGVIWSNGKNGDMIIRNQSGRELVFRNDGYLQLAHLAPGNTDTGNTVNGIRLQRGDTIFDSFNAWQSGEYVRAGWHFYNASGVDQWLALTDTGVKIWGSAANLRVEGVGNFWDVEIRSDRRVKSNIIKIDNALDKVSKLSGNVYDLKLPNGDTKPSAGLIAQEVQEVLPEAVTTDNDKDALLRLNYNAVIALLVESVKELKAEIEELKSK